MRGRTRVGALALGGAGAIVAEAAAVLHRTPRLNAPRGMRRGVVGEGEPRLNLLVLGESSAVGVGVGAVQDGLAPQLALKLSAQLQRSVCWAALGCNGLTAQGAVVELTPRLAQESAHVAVIVLGVNDALRLHSRRRWRRDLRALIEHLQRAVQPQLIALTPVPPLWKFRTLPQPLRSVLGAKAFALDRASRALAEQFDDVLYVPIPLRNQRRLLARDRLHPSRTGYRVMARYLSRAIAGAGDW